MPDIVITPNRGTTSNPKIDFTGTSAGTIKLEVLADGTISWNGGSGSLFSIADSLSGSLMSVNDASGLPVFEVFSDNKVVAGPYNQNAFVISAGGSIGIGTASPTSKFHVYQSGAPQFRLGNYLRDFVLTNNSGDNLLSFNYGGANRLQFNTTDQWFNSGSLGVGTATPAYRLDISGTGYASNDFRAPAFYYSSDTNSRWVNGYQLFLRGGSPTIYFRDTDHRSAMIHVNSNIFYVLRGDGTDSESWTTYDSRWPLEINLANNRSTFGGQVSAGSSAGGSLFIGTKAGAGYSDGVDGATFKSITDHPTGGSYAFAAYYNGSSGTNSFYVSAAGAGYFKDTLSAYSYSGNANVGGTGNASYHPNGIYSAGYNWIYGGINGGAGSATNFADMRANLFYDYNDTTYYVDPANGGFNLRGGTSNRVTYTTNDSGIFVANAEGTGLTVRIGAAWSRAGVYCNSYLDLGAETTINFRIANGEKGWMDSAANLFVNGSVRSPIFYDSNDTNYYLDPASSTTSLQIAGAIEQGNSFAHPNVTWSASGSSTGMVIFKLPGGSGNYGMIHMVFDIYEYSGNNIATVIVGGHNWNSNWYYYGAQVIGITDKSVRVGFKDGQYCVVFGGSASTWSYGQIRLRKIQNGGYYDNVMDLGGTYTVSQTTTESFTMVSGDLRSLSVANAISSQTNITAPIFYDYNDSGYYVDPNSTSDSALRVRGGAVFGPNTTWSRYLMVGGDGRQNYIDNASYASVTTTNGNLHLDAASGFNSYINWYDGTDLVIGAGDSSTTRLRVYGSSNYTEATGSLRAPLFYDLNNTGYYVDPASTTNIYQLNTASGIYNSEWFRNQNSGQGLYNAGTDSHFYSAGANYWHINNDSGTVTNGGLIFYDQYNPSQGNATGRRGYIYWDANGFGLLDSGGNWTFNIHPTDFKRVTIGGTKADNAYNTRDGIRLMFGGSDDSASGSYYIGTNFENYGGNYTKLDLRWHTGIRMGAQQNYGGTRIYNTETLSTLLFSVGKGDGHTRVESGNFYASNLYDINNTSYYVDPASTSSLLTLNIGTLQGFQINYSVYNSSNTFLATPSGINYQNAFIHFTGGNAIAPYAMYRSSGDWPAPYGIGFGTGGESSGIFQQYSSNGSALGEMVFYTGNDGAGSFAWRRHTWEGTTYQAAGSGNFATRLAYLDWAGNFTGDTSVRSPIFYDSNDTNYYLDPNGTSILNRLQLHSAKILTESNASGNSIEVYFRPNNDGTYVWRHIYAGTSSGFGTGAGMYGIYFSGNADYNVQYNSSGYTTFPYSARSPIFYDSNNTGYYCDPNGTSALNGLTIAGNNALYENTWINNKNFDSNGTIYSQASMRAPIFYDYNNTSYYVDPASDSVMNNIYIYGWYRSYNNYGLYNQSTTNHFYSDEAPYYNIAPNTATNVGLRLRTQGYGGTVRGYLYADTNNDVGILNNGGGWRIRVVGGDYVLFDGSSIRAQIFYDSNNTGYYVNPDGTSLLYQLNTNYNIYPQNYGLGIVGVYSSTRYQAVFAMGDSYKLAADGTTTGSLYGLAWSHPNAGGVAANLNTHGLLAMENGTWLASVSGSIRCRDDMRAPIYYDSNNTSYKVDAASSSKLGYLNLDWNWGSGDYSAEALTIQGSYPSICLRSTNSNSKWLIHNDGSGYIQLYNGSPWNDNSWTRYVQISSGELHHIGSIKSPIFYDYNNTGYYFDGASTSIINNVQITTLGVGTAASGTGGEIRATNNITAYYSDERLKTRIGAIEDPIGKIKALSGFYFEANEIAQKLGYEKKREVGVSAQEVQAVMPEVVVPAPISDKYLTVRYEKLIPLLIEAIKEQQVQIESLRDELAQFKCKK